MRRLTHWEILTLAKEHSQTIDPMLITAICMVESGGNPWAVRHEPGYQWCVPGAKRPLTCPEATEGFLQRTSWGLGQIMGATARDLGFDGWLTELLDPALNMIWVCSFIERLAARLYGHREDVISAYNAGSPRKTPGGQYVNQAYVDKVLDRLRILEQEIRV
jgi:hypothetical protein